jgi:hypothetical protein
VRGDRQLQRLRQPRDIQLLADHQQAADSAGFDFHGDDAQGREKYLAEDVVFGEYEGVELKIITITMEEFEGYFEEMLKSGNNLIGKIVVKV